MSTTGAPSYAGAWWFRQDPGFRHPRGRRREAGQAARKEGVRRYHHLSYPVRLFSVLYKTAAKPLMTAVSSRSKSTPSSKTSSPPNPSSTPPGPPPRLPPPSNASINAAQPLIGGNSLQDDKKAFFENGADISRRHAGKA
jgi:hypothetical protein